MRVKRWMHVPVWHRRRQAPEGKEPGLYNIECVRRQESPDGPALGRDCRPPLGRNARDLALNGSDTGTHTHTHALAFGLD